MKIRQIKYVLVYFVIAAIAHVFAGEQIALNPDEKVGVVSQDIYGVGYDGWGDIYGERSSGLLNMVDVRNLRIMVRLDKIFGQSIDDPINLDYSMPEDEGVKFWEKVQIAIDNGWVPFMSLSIHHGESMLPVWFNGIGEEGEDAWYRYNLDGTRVAEDEVSDQVLSLTGLANRLTDGLKQKGFQGLTWETIWEYGIDAPFVEIHHAVASGIKNADPLAKLGGPSTWPGGSVENYFIRPYLEKYGTDLLDFVSMHFYATCHNNMLNAGFVPDQTILTMDQGQRNYHEILMDLAKDYGDWCISSKEVINDPILNPSGKDIKFIISEYDLNAYSPYQKNPVNEFWPEYSASSDCYVNTNYFGAVWNIAVLTNILNSGCIDKAFRFKTRAYYGVISNTIEPVTYYKTPLWYAWKLFQDKGMVISGAKVLETVSVEDDPDVDVLAINMDQDIDYVLSANKELNCSYAWVYPEGGAKSIDTRADYRWVSGDMTGLGGETTRALQSNTGSWESGGAAWGAWDTPDDPTVVEFDLKDEFLISKCSMSIKFSAASSAGVYANGLTKLEVFLSNDGIGFSKWGQWTDQDDNAPIGVSGTHLLNISGIPSEARFIRYYLYRNGGSNIYHQITADEAIIFGKRAELRFPRVIVVNKSFANSGVSITVPDNSNVRRLKVDRYLFDENRTARFIGPAPATTVEGEFEDSPIDSPREVSSDIYETIYVDKQDGKFVINFDAEPISFSVLSLSIAGDWDNDDSVDSQDLDTLAEQWLCEQKNVTILNNSFEQPELSDGVSLTYTPAEWTSSGVVKLANPTEEQWNSRFLSEFECDGNQVITGSGGTVYQDLGIIKASTEYSVSIKVGLSFSSSGSAGVRLSAVEWLNEVELFNAVVADTLEPLEQGRPLADGKWVHQTFSWDSSGFQESIGKTLRLHLDLNGVYLDSVILKEGICGVDSNSDGAVDFEEVVLMADNWFSN